MEYSTEELHELHRIENEILDVVDEICRKYSIQYSLAYGTLLGAVRHKGPIPWDDDLDLMMEREEYDRFIQAWDKESPEGYILQNENNTYLYPNTFMKIRKQNSTFIQTEKELKGTYNTGIFIDIFPFDRVAPIGLERKKQYLCALLYLTMTKHRTSSFGGVLKLFELVLLSLPETVKTKIRRKTCKYIQKWNKSNKSDLLLVSFGNFKDSKIYFPSYTFDEYCELPYGSKMYSSIKCYEEVLRLYFGDYMTEPPLSERQSHSVIMLDFCNEYKTIT